MKRIVIRTVLGSFLALTSTSFAAGPPDWLQWGGNARHTGFVPVVAQLPGAILSDTVVDPNALASFTEEGELLAHYQVPLVEGNSVYMEVKGPTWSGHDDWQTQSWGMKRMDWKNGQLATTWSRFTGWKPVPSSELFSTDTYSIFEGPTWEPVYHGAVAGKWAYLPEAGGSVLKVDKETGAVVASINPFGSSINPNIYLSGPITVANSALVIRPREERERASQRGGIVTIPSADGNVYYNAIQLDPAHPWATDVVGSWLVRIAPDGAVSKVSYSDLTPDAPAASDSCEVSFFFSELPWPPSANALAPTIPCGKQRAAMNLAPAVAPDGTVYTASRAHFADRYGYLIAVQGDLTPRWAVSFRGRLNDGCGVGMPPNGSPGGCPLGTAAGVDPGTNGVPAGRINDDSTASPTVAPDGSVLFGVHTRYNFSQGHLMRFSSTGDFLGAFGFGWDMTAGIFPHDGTYSIVFKENHYGDVGSYCNDDTVCPPDRTATYPADPESYFVTQLSPSLVPEWRWQNKNTKSCVRNPDTTITCMSDHPNGFEFCVNQVAIDAHGVVYADSEDGYVYAVRQGGVLAGSLLLNQALGAAYTPVSIGQDGKVYSQNLGHMMVTGTAP